MGSFSSFFTGLSGIRAEGERLSMIGNNIANMNTVAFKENRIEFANLVHNSIVGDRGAVAGNGVAVAGASLNFAQGSLAQSNNAMDWAIDGKGFFVVNDSAGNSFYTRNGQLRLRAGKTSYSITNGNGHVLQGYLAQKKAAAAAAGTGGTSTSDTPAASGNEVIFASKLSDLTFDAVMPAKATSKVSMLLNLDSSEAVRTGTFKASNPVTYNFSVSETIFASNTSGTTSATTAVDTSKTSQSSTTTGTTAGSTTASTASTDASHTLTTFFVKTDKGKWNVYAQVDGGTPTAAGTLAFDTTGKLVSGATQTVALSVPMDGKSSTTQSQTVEIDLSGSTQYGASSAVLSQAQDGSDRGELQSITLGQNGIIYGNYSNQQHKAVGQVGLAAFGSPWGLRQSGQGLFVATQDSGNAAVMKPGESVGQVRSGFVELSNVEITDNFVDMIATQFGFQANSKAIMASDEILQQAINLKR